VAATDDLGRPVAAGMRRGVPLRQDQYNIDGVEPRVYR